MTDERHAHQGLPELHLYGAEHAGGRARVVRGARLAALIGALLLAAGLARTLIVRHANADVLAQRVQASSVLHVRVTEPRANTYDSGLSLPGTLQGIIEAQIYARANGYVKQWFKDIGEPVRKGDLLAMLDIPEVNKQVEEAAANFELARTAYERWAKLRERDAVSQQEFDEKAAAFQQSQAVLKRLRDQQSFGRVVAPFDGIVTRRNIDNGDLVNAGNGGSGQAMFATAQIDKLRVYVYVPQVNAEEIHVGDSVEVRRPEALDKPVAGKIVRTARAIDPLTRTLQVEIQLPNADHALTPGAYVDVAFKFKHDSRIVIPTATLLFGAGGTRVAVVGADNKIRLQAIELGTDYGHEVEVRRGLSGGMRLVMNPPDSVRDGQPVAVEAVVQAKKAS